VELGVHEDFMSESAVQTENHTPASKGPLSEVLIVAAVLITTLAAYIGTFWYEFVYDDEGQIVGNSYVQYWRHVPRYFVSQVWAHVFPRAGGNYYRPLFLLWLRLNDAWFGLRPEGWHATAIALHLLATFLVYLVARKLTNRISVAGFTALVFGLHPIHIEVVAWISGATESLCAVFVLAGFLAYLESRERNAAIWMTISCLLYAFAIFSKETGIVLPALVFAHCWIYSEYDAGEAKNTLPRLIACVRQVLVYVPVALVYLLMRVLVLRGMGHTVTRLGARQILFSIPSMLGFYVKKWFLPIQLAEFYHTPYWDTLNFWHVILPALLVVGLGVAIWMARNSLGAREVKFASCWIILPLLPLLDLRILPLDEIVHDRYFYLPSVGAALLVGLVVDRWTRAPRGADIFGFSAAQIAAALVLAATLGLLTVHESQPWANDYALYSRAYHLAPQSPHARLNYGAELMKRGDYDGGRVVLMEAMANDPKDWAPYMGLGRAAYEQGNYVEAQRWLHEAIQMDHDSADAYVNLGLTDLRMNHVKDAVGDMRTAAQIRPNDPTLLFAYGMVLELDGNCSLANDQFRAVLEIRPNEAYAETQLTRCQQAPARPSQN
jgi:Flp pilus assembly protein TadD/Gpi18-like mannosyltransferase